MQLREASQAEAGFRRGALGQKTRAARAGRGEGRLHESNRRQLPLLVPWLSSASGPTSAFFPPRRSRSSRAGPHTQAHTHTHAHTHALALALTRPLPPPWLAPFSALQCLSFATITPGPRLHLPSHPHSIVSLFLLFRSSGPPVPQHLRASEEIRPSYTSRVSSHRDKARIVTPHCHFLGPHVNPRSIKISSSRRLGPAASLS